MLAYQSVRPYLPVWVGARRPRLGNLRLAPRSQSENTPDPLQLLVEGQEKILKSLGNLETKVTSLDTKVTSLDAKVTSLDTKVTSLDTKLTSLDTSLDTKVTSLDTKLTSLDAKTSLEGSLCREIGSLREAQLRPEVGNLFGQEYCKQLTALSVQDLVRLLPDSAIYKPATNTDARRFVEVAGMVTSKLVAEEIPTRLLKEVHSRLQVKDQGWYDTELNLAKLGTFIGTCEDRPLREALLRLKNVVALPTDQQVEELLECDSAGVMCTLAAALPELYLTATTQPAQERLPSQELEFDLCGRVEVDSSFAYCDIGEVRTHADCASSVQQLGIRLRALAWLILAIQGRDDFGVWLVGRLFLPRGVTSDLGQQKTATESWNYSLYVHHL